MGEIQTPRMFQTYDPSYLSLISQPRGPSVRWAESSAWGGLVLSLAL